MIDSGWYRVSNVRHYKGPASYAWYAKVTFTVSEGLAARRESSRLAVPHRRAFHTKPQTTNPCRRRLGSQVPGPLDGVFIATDRGYVDSIPVIYDSTGTNVGVAGLMWAVLADMVCRARPDGLVSRAGYCPSKPRLCCCLEQVLASGNCIDGSVCGPRMSYSGCKLATALGGTERLSEDAAVASMYYSTAYKVFSPGTYTVLVRANSYQGCGKGSATSCILATGVSYTVKTGAVGQACCGIRAHCCAEAPPPPSLLKTPSLLAKG